MTKRICELKKGDRFILWGIERKVTAVNGRLYFQSMGHHSWVSDSMGSKSQMKVQVVGESQEVELGAEPMGTIPSPR